ncbi:MAG: hypothetical protein D6744_05355, partial [Planctomycetota bacterium]
MSFNEWDAARSKASTLRRPKSFRRSEKVPKVLRAGRGRFAAWGALLALALPIAALAGDPANGDLSKNDPLDIRVMSYNHHADFIADPSRDAAFNRILTAIDPDIICFQEFPTSVSESDVANRMDSILPTPGGWQVHFGKLGGVRNAIVSRYPLLMTRTDTIPASSTRGVTIALVDLPDATYTTDVYVLGVHLKCCGDPGGSEDASRQDSTDAITNWLGDARGVSRPSGNNVVLPTDTPMIVLGDFNFVGGPQPELTLRNGDIQDEGTYGPDVKGDWDVSDMFDVHPIDASSGDDFTWQGSGSFPPSRLDRFYITDSVVTIGENFVLNTDTMSSAALANAGLQASDTLPSSTSDHLPIVMDLQLSGGGCPDSDGDGVCDPNDLCPGFDDNLDTDGDGVPDGCDICPGGDDNIDTDGDGVPDFCDPCPLDNPDDS